MKSGISKTFTTLLATAGIWAAASISANATLTWDLPITVNSHDIVGAANILHGDHACGDITTVFPIAQNLLTLGPNVDGYPGLPPDNAANRRYRTSSTDYNGTLVLATAITGSTTYIPSGYEYVVGKYDGQNAGYILFYLGGQDADLPASCWSIWGRNAGQYGLSGWYAFNPVPEPTTLIAGVGALGMLLFGARVRNKRSVLRIGK